MDISSFWQDIKDYIWDLIFSINSGEVGPSQLWYCCRFSPSYSLIIFPFLYFFYLCTSSAPPFPYPLSYSPPFSVFPSSSSPPSHDSQYILLPPSSHFSSISPTFSSFSYFLSPPLSSFSAFLSLFLLSFLFIYIPSQPPPSLVCESSAKLFLFIICSKKYQESYSTRNQLKACYNLLQNVLTNATSKHHIHHGFVIFILSPDNNFRLVCINKTQSRPEFTKTNNSSFMGSYEMVTPPSQTARAQPGDILFSTRQKCDFSPLGIGF